MKRTLYTLGFVATCGYAGQAYADLFHYNNLLQGDRAQGLGGAYTGISDDASGMVYNPAGLAFALSNDISGSVNAFYTRETVYEKAIGDTDFVEESNGSVAPFFGIMQKLDKHVPGLVGAFGNYFTDSDLKEQDDLIEDKTIGTSEIGRFHRAVNARASTNYWTAAVGYRISKNFSVGFGLNYFNVDELVQEYQDAKQKRPNLFGEGSPGWTVLSQNIVTRLSIHGLEPVLGFQFVVGSEVSLGLSIRQGFVASQNLQFDSETRTNAYTEDQIESLNAEEGYTASSGSNQSVKREKNKNPIGSWPAQVRFGAAWFANTRFLMAFDIAHYTAVEDAGGIESLNDKVLYNREAVTNYHLGAEYYVAPAFPLRLGVFTNNDARPELEEGEAGQPDHIDYLGESLFIAWVQPNSQMAFGAVFQQGSGQAQKLGDTTIQDVTATSQTLAFSATHNF